MFIYFRAKQIGAPSAEKSKSHTRKRWRLRALDTGKGAAQLEYTACENAFTQIFYHRTPTFFKSFQTTA